MGKRALAAALAALLLAGCAVQQTPAEKTVFCMDTVMELRVWGRDGQTACDALEDALLEMDRTWNASSEASALAAYQAGEPVSQEAQDVLARVQALKERTGGAFDPQLYRLTEAWGFFSGDYRVPTPAEIQAALADPVYDLGGVIKGYAGEKLAALLSELEVDRAVLNLGGNVQTYGEKPGGEPWQIALQDPRGAGQNLVVSVTGTMAVVTSGDYQRYFELDGVRYHHIMDPWTGYPADSGLASVTVICADGMTADALSTALFVLGLEEGTALWRASEDFEAVFILTDGQVYATQGAALSGGKYQVISR